MNLDEKMDHQVLEQHTIFTAQLETLRITAKENKRTLKYLIEMKIKIFIKVGELKASIQEFRGEIKKD